MSDDLASLIIQLFCYGILLAFYFGVPFLVYRDANKLGRNGGLWAVMTFFLWPLVLPLYLCVRKPNGNFTQPRGYR
jgi:hypothetical protein